MPKKAIKKSTTKSAATTTTTTTTSSSSTIDLTSDDNDAWIKRPKSAIGKRKTTQSIVKTKPRTLQWRNGSLVNILQNRVVTTIPTNGSFIPLSILNPKVSVTINPTSVIPANVLDAPPELESIPKEEPEKTFKECWTLKICNDTPSVKVKFIEHYLTRPECSEFLKHGPAIASNVPLLSKQHLQQTVYPNLFDVPDNSNEPWSQTLRNIQLGIEKRFGVVITFVQVEELQRMQLQRQKIRSITCNIPNTKAEYDQRCTIFLIWIGNPVCMCLHSKSENVLDITIPIQDGMILSFEPSVSHFYDISIPKHKNSSEKSFLIKFFVK